MCLRGSELNVGDLVEIIILGYNYPFIFTIAEFRSKLSPEAINLINMYGAFGNNKGNKVEYGDIVFLWKVMYKLTYKKKKFLILFNGEKVLIFEQNGVRKFPGKKKHLKFIFEEMGYLFNEE